MVHTDEQNYPEEVATHFFSPKIKTILYYLFDEATQDLIVLGNMESIQHATQII